MTQFSIFEQFKNIIIALIVCFALSPVTAFAAKLYLEPAQEQYQSGDTFTTDIKIDTEGECINVAEINLSFSKNILSAVNFNQGKSILILWVKNPEINQDSGLISFSGGIPGGYCGRIPGDAGPSNSLGEIIFRVPGMRVGNIEENLAKVEFLDSSQILLNDGLGTKAKLNTQGATFEIIDKSEPSQNEWQKEIREDDILPEFFIIEIYQDKTTFEGKYFVIFSTTDKQTGLDYYEIKEGKEDWQKAESPYLLKDQTLQSIIKVKAVDKAGNERIIEYTSEIPTKPSSYWIFVLVLTGIGIIYWIAKKYKKTKCKITI